MAERGVGVIVGDSSGVMADVDDEGRWRGIPGRGGLLGALG